MIINYFFLENKQTELLLRIYEYILAVTYSAAQGCQLALVP